MSGAEPTADRQTETAAPDVRETWSWPDPVQAASCAWDVCRASWLDSAELGRLARRRWQDLAQFAREQSPFYRDLYSQSGALGEAELDRLPPVAKADMMSNLDRVLTRTELRGGVLRSFLADTRLVGQPFGGGCAVWASSGTSGEPGVFVHDPHALAIYDALQLFRFRGAGVSVDGNVLPLSLERYALVAATGGHFAGASSVERLRRTYPWLAPTLRVFSLMQPLPELVEQLNAFLPDIVATYPSAAAQLARERVDGRLAITPSQIWTGGECLSPAIRALVETAFAARVRDEYGASEFPSIGVGCAAGWLHVNADWVVLEPVDEHYRPVAPGEASHTVLLTNLANRVQPLIRYDLGDSVTLREDPCECGNRLPAVRVEGRCDDPLQFAGREGRSVTLNPLVLTTVIEEGADLYDFQLAQSGPGCVCLTVGEEDAGKADDARRALARFLEEQGLSEVRIDLGAEMPRREARGGKLRRIVSRMPAAGPAAMH